MSCLYKTVPWTSNLCVKLVYRGYAEWQHTVEQTTARSGEEKHISETEQTEKTKNCESVQEEAYIIRAELCGFLLQDPLEQVSATAVLHNNTQEAIS